MAEDHREGQGAGASRVEVDVAATDSTEDDPGEDAAGLGVGDGDLPGLEPVRLDQNGSATGATHHFSSPRPAEEPFYTLVDERSSRRRGTASKSS